MSARDIIIRPIVTEKSMRLNSEEHKVTFEVAKGASKTEIAQAVREIYGFAPVKINVINVAPRKKRVGRYVGKTAAVRKAIVRLPQDQDIDFDAEAK